MYLFNIFRSFLPMHNPIGFGASDFVFLALAVLLTALLSARAYLAPYIRQIAGRTALSMCLFFVLPVVLRLALLPRSPVPIPAGADDFAYVLLGDTIRHFQFANSPHPLHQFFEAVFILQQPAYASIYPLGQGFVLALGRMLLHSDWAGVLLSGGVFCAFCYWMLRAWIAPVWAFAGGLLAVIEFGPLSPWTNSYWGGFVSGIAGCLVFGSLPRLREFRRIRDGLALGAGLALQILTRPFEAVFLAAAAAIYIAYTFRSRSRVLLRPGLACLGAMVAACGLTLIQNKAVTQSWFTMPYMLSRYEYGVPATFTFQPNPVPHRQLTAEQDLDYKAQVLVHGSGEETVGSYFRRLASRIRFLRFFLLPPLYLVAFALKPKAIRKRYVWAALTIGLLALGSNFYPYFYPHYIAAATCLFVLFSVLGLEHFGAAGRYLGVLCAAAFAFWFAIFASGNFDLLSLTHFQNSYFINWGDPQGRIAIQDKLSHSPGRQLVFVRYSPFHRFEEWIHNDADIDSAQIVWANDLGAEENQKLAGYYPNRTVWLLEPDARPPALTPYPTESGPFVTVH